MCQRLLSKLVFSLYLLTTSVQSSNDVCIPLKLSHAKDQKSLEWGLMGKEHLKDNEGMLFHFPSKKKRIFWAFNCLFDLSVAFLNEEQVIEEIQDLKAYPQMMDPSRPLRRHEDLRLYPADDPIRLFFLSRAVQSKMSSCFVLEMKKGAFEKLGIVPGDAIFWDAEQAYASPKLFICAEQEIHFKKPKRLVLEALESLKLHFLDNEGSTERFFLLKKGQSVVSKKPVTGFMTQKP